MKFSSYNKGKRWGHAIFSVNGDSKSGLMKSDAAMATVRRYARDPSVKKTKTGKVLTPELRQVYQGVYDGFYEAFSKADRKANALVFPKQKSHKTARVGRDQLLRAKSQVFQRKQTKATKRGIIDSFGSLDKYSALKRETERMKAQDAYDFFYGDRDYR